MPSRPDATSLIGKNPYEVPMSLQRIAAASSPGESHWIGPKQAATINTKEKEQYALAQQIMEHLCIQAPFVHQSGHPGGPLSAFTFAYHLSKRRDPHVDQPLRISAGHLSLLSYGLQWLFGREGHDPRLASPQAIMDHFRIPKGLPGHVEAGIGDMPFGTGPLGKGVSHALGAAFGLKYQKKPGIVDVLLADGDSQEGQVAEAFRLASRLQLDNLIVHGDFNDIQLSDLPSRTVAPDLAAIAASEGWNVIEVQNGNDPGQVVAALALADEKRAASNGSTDLPAARLPDGQGRQGSPQAPTFICYYTTMGNGVTVMADGSNTGKKNFHGSPLTKEEVEHSLKELPPLPELVKAYQPFHEAEHRRYIEGEKVATDLPLPWKLHKGYTRTVTDKPGAARKDFGAIHLKNLMKNDARIVVLHADLAGSGGFDPSARFACSGQVPRIINVGVAEANMYMMAAGMRQVGLLPVTYTFAAFGTNEARANARLIDVNCGHTRCGVLHDCTHAGLSVGEDGETHQEQNYLNIPFRHTQVWMPSDCNQAGAMAERALEIIAEGHQSVYVFSARSDHPQVLTKSGKVFYDSTYVFDGKADMIRGLGNGADDVTVISSGIILHEAIKVIDELESRKRNQESGISVRLLNVSCVRPIDAAAIIQAALETHHIIVAEDHNTEGGIASQVADIIADFQLPCSLRRLGLNHYFPSGKAEDLFLFAGLDSESILNAILDEMKIEVTGGVDAFVSALYTLSEHVGISRFRTSAQPFVERLLEEKGYIENLRDLWKARTVAINKFPTNEQLKERLGRVKSPLPMGEVS